MVPLDKIEVDLMAIRLGKLILVECKESGERLVEPNEGMLGICSKEPLPAHVS